MILVAYVAILCGLGNLTSRYSRLALRYHANSLQSGTMVDVFQGLIEKERANLKRGRHREGTPAPAASQTACFLRRRPSWRGSKGNSTEQFKRYRFGLIADGEDRQAQLALQNLGEYTDRIEVYRKLADKYAKAAQEPW